MSFYFCPSACVIELITQEEEDDEEEFICQVNKQYK